jgi:hypothetical protein
MLTYLYREIKPGLINIFYSTGRRIFFAHYFNFYQTLLDKAGYFDLYFTSKASEDFRANNNRREII